MCLYLKLHNGHKLLLINDEEALKKENITIESSTKQYNDFIEKTVNLKEKIEKEMTEIDKLYDKINKEVSLSFEKKHEQLIKEENCLKENLQNEVTKVKEQLEYCLSESNRLIKISEKINKGIKILEKEKKNMIKILSYVSNINKNQKEMKALFQKLMRSIKISFNEKDCNMKFNEYYFNGIQTPKDIEFKDISLHNFIIFWKIDNLNIINIDNNKIKYKVEIRKDNDDEKFIQIYEGNNNNFSVKNVVINTNYEIRICCLYNDFVGSWSPIAKVKTLDNEYLCNSIILEDSKRKNEFLKQIYEWCGCRKFELLYRGSRDGTTSKIFHEKCDNQGPTICLYKNNKDYIFGGYSSISWTNKGSQHSAPDSFVFYFNKYSQFKANKISKFR